MPYLNPNYPIKDEYRFTRTSCFIRIAGGSVLYKQVRYYVRRLNLIALASLHVAFTVSYTVIVTRDQKRDVVSEPVDGPENSKRMSEKTGKIWKYPCEWIISAISSLAQLKSTGDTP